jgi:hypothetical protein
MHLRDSSERDDKEVTWIPSFHPFNAEISFTPLKRDWVFIK